MYACLVGSVTAQALHALAQGQWESALPVRSPQAGGQSLSESVGWLRDALARTLFVEPAAKRDGVAVERFFVAEERSRHLGPQDSLPQRATPLERLLQAFGGMRWAQRVGDGATVAYVAVGSPTIA